MDCPPPYYMLPIKPLRQSGEKGRLCFSITIISRSRPARGRSGLVPYLHSPLVQKKTTSLHLPFPAFLIEKFHLNSKVKLMSSSIPEEKKYISSATACARYTSHLQN